MTHLRPTWKRRDPPVQGDGTYDEDTPFAEWYKGVTGCYPDQEMVPRARRVMYGLWKQVVGCGKDEG